MPIHVSIYIYIHRHTHKHTYLYTQTHTQTHTHIYIYIYISWEIIVYRRISTATLTGHVRIESNQATQNQMDLAGAHTHKKNGCTGMFGIDAPALGTPISLFSMQECA